MAEQENFQLARLTRCLERLKEEYDLDAPRIIKLQELHIAADIIYDLAQQLRQY